ncbi:MAG: hypothetical protein Q4B60_09580 [Erysipelotrichaceae bacterium]|nr:hypothetical protein [Erysipelotrichaceae bacterium]
MTKEENKMLIDEIPFLVPRNRWTDEVDEKYDYSYTELDMAEVPSGWNQYLLPLARELNEVLKRIGYEDEYRILQIKEKYNSLRWYSNVINEELSMIVGKYSDKCRHTCHCCGKKAKWETSGWIASYCDDCFKKIYDNNPDEYCLNLDNGAEDD